MGMEKQGSKSGGYVGGFLQMFDWNAKSRKKLFSNNFDLPEQSKQKKICDGNLPMTRLYMSDDDLTVGRTGNNRSGYYSCASSITDNEFCETKSPGVVGRLMGLDSLPKSNILDSYSTPLFDTRSLPDVHYRPNDLQDHEVMQSSNIITKPIEKFRTEILPPKSAKPVPITQHKLLSPIKSVNIIPPEDGARIMEAAARIIEPGRQTTVKGKTVRSSSAPLRVQGSKEKVLEPQKPSKLCKASEKPSESSAGAVYLKGQPGQPRTKSWGESVDSKSLRIFADSDECSSSVKSTGKSISLALLAKANVQKREGLSASGSRILVNQDVQNEIKSQPSMQKINLKKQSTQDGPLVFQENNQKQNGVAEKRKAPSVKSLGGKALGGDSSSARRKNSSKLAEGTEVGSTRSSLEGKDDRNKKVTSKKPSQGDYRYKKNKATNNTMIEKNQKMIQSSWDKNDDARKAMDVVSFTFTAPMTRSGPESTEVWEKCKRLLESSDGLNASKFSFPGHNILRGDALSTLLEQKLKELTNVVEFPHCASRSPSQFQDPGLNASTLLHEGKTNDGVHKYNPISQFDSSFSDDHQGSKSRNQFQGVQEMEHLGSKVCEAENLLDPWLPSPVSILEQSMFAESYSSLDTVDSNSTTGSRQCSSVQAQEVLSAYSWKKLVSTEGDAELADSASSISLSKTHSGKSTEWEPKYVKEVLCNIELMFKDYALGHSREVINPNIFDQLENWKGTLNDYDIVPRIDRRLLFDCVSECLESKCRGYVCGGSQMWGKGVSAIKRKEMLAQEVYGEILGWSSMGDCMVDELVDKDMSSRHGRWLDFETEAYELGKEIEDRVLNSLLDEVVADILVL